jgi:hypothetical protein
MTLHLHTVKNTFPPRRMDRAHCGPAAFRTMSGSPLGAFSPLGTLAGCYTLGRRQCEDVPSSM